VSWLKKLLHEVVAEEAAEDVVEETIEDVAEHTAEYDDSVLDVDPSELPLIMDTMFEKLPIQEVPVIVCFQFLRQIYCK